MATVVIMPRQGQSVESCIIAKWHKQEGDAVAEGDMLFTYETDKATFDEEAKVSGTMLKLFFEEGDDVPCLTNVCVIGNPGESFAEFAPKGEEQEQNETVVQVVEEKPVEVVATENKDGVEKISPRAKNLAAKSGADLSKAVATGPYGRIIERDIEKLINDGNIVSKAAMGEYTGGATGTGIGGSVVTSDLSQPAEAVVAPTNVPDVEVVKNTTIRKAIAKAMHGSLSTMAQLTLNSSFDATNIMAYRSMVKNNMESLGLSNITLNDIILYAVSRVIKNHRELNAYYYDTEMHLFNSVNLGVAVDTPRGLMVPTIFNADKKSLNQISAEAKVLAKQCKEGTINPDLLKGGTFTVTNLGTFGIESFTPVINPPQTGILGVNTIVKKPKEVDGQIKLYPSMGLSITFDHRAVDGGPAAKFLSDLGKALENFSALLAL